MGLADRVFGFDKREEALRQETAAQIAKVERRTAAQLKKSQVAITKAISTQIDASFTKAANPEKPGILRYALDPQNMNNGVYRKSKPDASVPFEVLRKFSINHEISRAAINYRKRQVARLDWDIVSENADSTTLDKSQADEVKMFFKGIGGAGTKYRKFIGKLIEDLLVLDAVSLYKRPTLGGGVYTIEPIDAATIRLVVDDSGSTPLPPDIAYKQIIRGRVVAEFTTDELIYDMMNPRTNSPYGLAPLESLLVIVSSSLKAGLANLAYLTDGNIPEGFFGVPKEWTPQMIKDFQENWDAVMAGDAEATAKLKFAPEGSYQPAKKQSDMAWNDFNDWLMKVTCALFDVQPSEIGFHPVKGGLGGTGMAQQSNETSDEKGLQPLAQFIEEIFTEVIQVDLGFTNLKFHFSGLDQDADAKTEAEVNEILIRSGQRTVDELRTDDGLKAIGVDKPFVLGTPTFIDAESLQSKADAAAAIATATANAPAADPNPPADGTEQTPPDPNAAKAAEAQHMVDLVTEFRKFRKMAITRKKSDKPFREFESSILPEATLDELNDRIHKAVDVDEVKGVFAEFMQDYQIDFIADVIELQGNLQKILR